MNEKLGKNARRTTKAQRHEEAMIARAAPAQESAPALCLRASVVQGGAAATEPYFAATGTARPRLRATACAAAMPLR